jgi:hypothetical protein
MGPPHGGLLWSATDQGLPRADTSIRRPFWKGWPRGPPLSALKSFFKAGHAGRVTRGSTPLRPKELLQGTPTAPTHPFAVHSVKFTGDQHKHYN